MSDQQKNRTRELVGVIRGAATILENKTQTPEEVAFMLRLVVSDEPYEILGTRKETQDG